MEDSPPKFDGIPPLDFTKEEQEKRQELSAWTTAYNCHFCGTGLIVPTRECMACHQNACKTHVSANDLDLCHECAAEPNRDPLPPFNEPSVIISPLVDDEGVRHTGKLITPVGDTFVASRYIDTLTDTEQEAMLLEYRTKVQEAEKILYAHTIVASTVEMAISERKRKAKIATRAARIVQTPSGKQIVLPGRQTAAPQKSKMEVLRDRLKSMSKEEKQQLLSKMLDVLKSK